MKRGTGQANSAKGRTCIEGWCQLQPETLASSGQKQADGKGKIWLSPVQCSWHSKAINTKLLIHAGSALEEHQDQ
eukprot:1191261-Amphidinium_carterae.1